MSGRRFEERHQKNATDTAKYTANFRRRGIWPRRQSLTLVDLTMLAIAFYATEPDLASIFGTPPKGRTSAKRARRRSRTWWRGR